MAEGISVPTAMGTAEELQQHSEVTQQFYYPPEPPSKVSAVQPSSPWVSATSEPSLLAKLTLLTVYAWFTGFWALLVLRRVKPGLPRGLLAAPVVVTNFLAPLLLNHEMEPMIITPLAGAFSLSAFKLCAYVIARGPLTLAWLTPAQFIALVMLPVVPAEVFEAGIAKGARAGSGMSSRALTPVTGAALRHGPPSARQVTVDYCSRMGVALLVSWVLIVPNLPVMVRHWLYTLSSAVFLTAVFDLMGAWTHLLLGLTCAPSFNKPWLCDSFQDFWARRWNLVTTYMMRVLVYEPVVEARLMPLTTPTASAAGAAGTHGKGKLAQAQHGQVYMPQELDQRTMSLPAATQSRPALPAGNTAAAVAAVDAAEVSSGGMMGLCAPQVPDLGEAAHHATSNALMAAGGGSDVRCEDGAEARAVIAGGSRQCPTPTSSANKQGDAVSGQDEDGGGADDATVDLLSGDDEEGDSGSGAEGEAASDGADEDSAGVEYVRETQYVAVGDDDDDEEVAMAGQQQRPGKAAQPARSSCSSLPASQLLQVQRTSMPRALEPEGPSYHSAGKQSGSITHTEEEVEEEGTAVSADRSAASAGRGALDSAVHAANAAAKSVSNAGGAVVSGLMGSMGLRRRRQQQAGVAGGGRGSSGDSAAGADSPTSSSARHVGAADMAAMEDSVGVAPAAAYPAAGSPADVSRRPSTLRRFLGLQATFLLSGAWHILIFWYNTRVFSWRWCAFFTIQATILMIERSVKKVSKRIGIRLPHPLQVFMANFLLIAVARPLFFGPTDDTGFAQRNLQIGQDVFWMLLEAGKRLIHMVSAR